MNDADWMKLFVEHSSSVMTFWHVYVLVVTVLVGFVTQIEELDSIRYFLVIAFAFFALTNLYPMYQAQVTLEKIREKMSDEAGEIFQVSSALMISVVHVILDVFVIWFLICWGRCLLLNAG